MGRATSNCFGPAPWGPGEGAKRSNIIYFQLQSQFQRFLYQTVCVFSQIKDTKHIKRDLHHVAWVMTLGRSVPRGGGVKTIQIWSCGISNRRG